MSPSARRAWIEIFWLSWIVRFWDVALRKEGVDRNNTLPITKRKFLPSPSARRAWIEIP